MVTSSPDRRPDRTWDKTDVVNHLAAAHGYREYLELCTANTGQSYGSVDRSRLHCHRLMYRCPDGFDDGLVVDFRSRDEDVSECLREVNAQGLRFDVVFVDSWHTYDLSRRDLDIALDLVADGGVVVVHDCNPPSAEYATPNILAAGWCGVTYRAYLDVVAARDDLAYYTVDIDYGVGVIRKRPAESPTDAETLALVRSLRGMADAFAAFRFFQHHNRQMLKLRSVGEFVAAEDPSSSGVQGRPIVDVLEP